MSQQHPIIAVKDSSGAGTTTVKDTLDYDRAEMKIEREKARWKNDVNVTD